MASFPVMILKHIQVTPSQSPDPHSLPPLPLTFFDIPWLLFPPSQPLFFYKNPVSPSAIIPTLLQSLSLTLLHFLPLAGSLSIPSLPSKPEFVYDMSGSVSVTISESSTDFPLLVSDSMKKANLFQSLVPEASNLLSIQVTLFPGSGVCIGFSLNQAVADERTFNMFLKSWASISRQIFQEKSILAIEIEPFFNRAVIKDQNGLGQILLDEIHNRKYLSRKHEEKPVTCSQDIVQATFVLTLSDMEKIKTEIVNLCEKNSHSLPVRLSPYVIASAFIWVTLIKAQNCTMNGKNAHEKEEMLSFGFIAGGITRLKNYKVPGNYFGNCVAFGKSSALEKNILRENGIIFAAKAVAESIETLDNDVLGGAKRWIRDLEELFANKNSMVVVGSPKVDLYDTDFGWGRVKKIEDASIVSLCIEMGVKAVSFSESRDFKGGIEVGIVLPRLQMDAFSSFFNQGLGFSNQPDSPRFAKG